MLKQYQCQDCSISFDTQQALATHKQKFCLHSKYADLDSLTKQFSQIKGPKNNLNLDNFMQSSGVHFDSPLQQNLKTSSSSNKKDLDRQYRELLRQIGDREDLKKKLEREKIIAEDELQGLEKKEKEAYMNVRQKDLEEVVNRREQLAKEEEQLQKEIRSFENERKEESKVKNMNSNEDFQYREGREAGKLAMHRRLLEEKKRDIEANLKRKHREEEKILKEIDSIKDKPIYIPEYRKKQNVPVVEKPSQVFQPGYSNASNNVLSPTKRNLSNQQPYEPLQMGSRTKQLPQNQTRTYLRAENILKPEIMPRQNVLQVSNFNKSQLSQIKEEDDEYLKAALFTGKEKTLFESLNPKGKGDEDIFIESLVAQEYDALNVLARLPKDSELYMVKMKQFREMSRLRQDLKDKVHKVRLEKVKREFEIEKQMTETEKENLQWLDKNRRNMLNRQVGILNQNQTRQQQQLQLENQKPNYPDVREETKRSNPFNQSTSLITPPAKMTPLAKMPSIQAFSRSQLQSKNGSRGYKITIKSVKNYSNRSPMCVRLMLLEEGDKTGQQVYTTKYHDEQGPRDERNPYNPGIRNRLDEAGSVVFNETFDMREDLQNRYNRNQKEIYLWTMLMEKDSLNLSNEPQLYLWYCLKLTHFGQIKEGVFTLSLYHDNCPFPNPPDMNRMKTKANEQLVIQLSDTILTNAQKNVREIDRLESSISIKNNIGKRISPKQTIMMKAKRNSKEGTLQSINEQFFIENQNMSEFQSVKREDKVSFDFGINGLRTLPSYTGPIRLQVSFIDCANSQVLEQDEILGEFGEDMYNPRVNFTKRVRKRSIPSSTMVVIKIIGIVTLNYEPGLLGFASFHLCFDEEGNTLESDRDNYFLINGLYQLPIYWGNASRYIPVNQLDNMYPAIPCSSILVSVNNPSETPRVVPKYSEGVYNTSFFEVDEVQYRLFQEQAKREKLKTLDYVNSYYKFKGVNTAGYREEDLKKLLNQALAFNKENTSNLLMLGWMAEYSTSFGFKFALDSIRIPSDQANYYYFCTACLFPPANYYSTQQQADLQFFYQIDLGSSLTSCLYLAHQPLNFFPKYDPNTSLIIELNRVQLSQNGSPDSSIQTCAYTVLPLFDLSQTTPCLNVGIKEMKMVEGEFGQRELKELQANTLRFIEQMEGKKKSQFVTIGRILNGYFGKQLPPAISNKIQGKPLRSIYQNSKGFRLAEEGVKRIIEDTYGVKLS